MYNEQIQKNILGRKVKKMNRETFKSNLLSGAYDSELKRVYVTESEVKKQEKRYAELYDLFCEEFKYDENVSFVSAPGRTEVCGNHTDHNHGKVLAAAINLDAVAAVHKVDGNIIKVKSVGHQMDTIDLLDLSVHTELYSKSSEIIRGMCAGFVERGYKVGAFEAYTTSNVLSGSGLSSSAAFEVLIGAALNSLFNDNQVSAEEIAKIAQFAENKYFGKPCGLMDQMASSVGSFVEIDFKDNEKPVITKVNFDFSKSGYCLC
ncbi:MAG: galactokinase, partial [Clostridia bacterium]|nr:galactokinase [Clostridia bacterium]